MKLVMVNLTPHAINLMNSDRNILKVFPPEGSARVTATRTPVETLDLDGVTVKINATVFSEVVGLPAPQDGVRYIVSAITAKAAPDRHDLLLPDDAVRDEDGRIIGCQAFAIP